MPLRRAGEAPDGIVALTRLHAASVAGDALVTVALAGSLFFAVPVGEARGRVALYLLSSMAPFAVVAPLLGPLLDRMRHGRRSALALTGASRATCAWFMAGAGALAIYPLAFGVLVSAKAYGVARAAAVPRVLRPGSGLVSANARLSAAGLLAGIVGAGAGAGLTAVGSPAWSLRLAVLVHVAVVVLALRLPDAVNSPRGDEQAAHLLVGAHRVPSSVRYALTGFASIRALAGYLTLFLAFLVRADGEEWRLGVVAAAAALGGAAGTGVGTRLRTARPPVLLSVALLLPTLTAVLAAWRYSLGTAALVAAATGTAGALGRLAFDATVQSDVAEHVRAGVFARGETAMQLAWVLGGGLGIALPLSGRLGLGVAAAALIVACVALLPRLLAHPHTSHH